MTANKKTATPVNEDPWEQLKIDLGELQVDRKLQPRVALDLKTVQKYKDAMERGEEFPPLKVARIDGKFYVVAGLHRLQAYEETRRDAFERGIDCLVKNMTKWEALECAAMDNMRHGLPYSKRDQRRANEKLVLAYVRQGKHLERGKTIRLKSFAQIARDLDNAISDETIRKIMTKNHAPLLRKYGKLTPFAGNAPTRKPADDSDRAAFVLSQMVSLKALIGQTEDEDRKAEILRSWNVLEALLRNLRDASDDANVDDEEADF